MQKGIETKGESRLLIGKDELSLTGHTLNVVLGFMHRLAQDQIVTWLCGGWAEELRGVCSSRPHRDIDLLYPTRNFEQLDQYVANAPDLTDILAKRFSHKRAILYQNIMVEIMMLESIGGGGYVTNFFNQRYRFCWPPDTLSFVIVNGQELPVISRDALRMYRQQHLSVVRAHQNYLQE